MKRKLIALLVAMSIAVSPICVYADEKDDRIKELELQVEQMQATIDELKTKLEKYEGAGIEQYLLDKGLLSGERIEMAADMIGALSGFKYGEVEIYEFDKNSDEYKSLEAGNAIPIRGVEGALLSAEAINDGYVLFGSATDDLISAFKEYN